MIDQIINMITSKYPSAEGIYLFGSHAKGTNDEESDIDICVKMPSEEVCNRYDAELKTDLIKALGVHVDLVFSTMMNDWCVKLIYNNKS